MQAVGTCHLKVTNPSSNRKYSIEFVVVDNDDLTPLLGFKTSQQMGLITVNTDKFVCMNVTTGFPSQKQNLFEMSLRTYLMDPSEHSLEQST